MEPDNDDDNNNTNNKATSFEFQPFSGPGDFVNGNIMELVNGNIIGHQVTQHDTNSVVLADSLASISSFEKRFHKQSSRILKENGERNQNTTSKLTI